MLADNSSTENQESGSVLDGILSFFGLGADDSTAASADLISPDLEGTSSDAPIVNETTLPEPEITVTVPDPIADTTAGIFLGAASTITDDTGTALMQTAEEDAAPVETPAPEVAEPEAPAATDK